MKKLIILLLTSFSFATIINIPDDYSTIQEGIDTSVDGDTVLVQPGIYVENINFNGKNILVGSQFIIDSNEAYINQTIVDGNANGLPVVSFYSGETRDAVLQGFTIQNGTTEVNSYGAGIDFRTNNSSATLKNLIITNNHANNGSGGGISIYYAGSVLIQDCWIYNNYAGIGGGVYSFDGDSLFINNSRIMMNQSAGGSGIAIWRNTPLIVDHSIVSGNIGSSAIGLGHEDSQNVIREFTNCTIANNSTAFGITQEGGFSTSVINNCIIYDHQVGSINLTGGVFQIDYTLVEGDADGWGVGNIDLNPLFSESENYDYSLQISSPCIDAGNPDLNGNGITWENDPDDQDPDGTRMDMGAYYFIQIIGCTNPIALNFNPDANVDDGSCVFPVYGCVDSTAFNFNDEADINDGSCIYYGDVTQDGSIDVIDVIAMVGYVLGTIQPTPDQIILGDVFTDGDLNIFDIVSLIALIFEIEGLMDLTSLTQATLNQHHNTLSFSKTGVIAGVELEYSGDINFDSTPDGWLIEKNENTILMVSLDGSDFNKVHYSGDLKIKSCTVVDWELNKIQAEIIVVPTQFSLKPAYPNPFNPVTTINYAIPHDANVVIKAFDVRGKEVAELVNGQIDEGYHEVVWDASKLSSGMYFVRMTSGDYKAVQKTIFVK
jgi:hypothetical protein